MPDKVVPINPVIKHYNSEMLNDLLRDVSQLPQRPYAEKKISHTWITYFADLSSNLSLFPCLCLKDGYALRAYVFAEYEGMDGDGHGIVWAMPEHVSLPDVPKTLRSKPPGALNNIMEAIKGDGSLWSFMCASIFFCGMSDFGLGGHMWNLETGKIIENDTWQSPEGYRSLDDFEWHEPKPLNFNPEVKRENNIITVTLHTREDYAPGRLTRFVDVYNHRNYCFKREETIIAEDGGILYL
jgi:hypothetical protein